MRHLSLFVGLASVVVWSAPLPAQTDPVADAARRLAEVAPMLGWSTGAPDAPVLIVEFSDPSCPWCAQFHADTRAALRHEFVDGGQVRWITLSYVSGLYPNSLLAAEAAECAGAQGRHEEFLDATYRGRDEWMDAGSAEAARVLAARAEALGLAMDAWRACLAAPDARARIRRVNALAADLAVRGTPTWFVDGFAVMGALPLDYARRFVLERLEGLSAEGAGTPIGARQPISAAYPSR